jgi:hypothetical protein
VCVCVCVRVDPESNACRRSGEGRGRWIDILQVLGGLQHTHCVGGLAGTMHLAVEWQPSGSRQPTAALAAFSPPPAIMQRQSNVAMLQCSPPHPPRTDAVPSPQLQMIFPRHATQRSGALGRCGRLSSTRHPRLAPECATRPWFLQSLAGATGPGGAHRWAGVGGLWRAFAGYCSASSATADPDVHWCVGRFTAPSPTLWPVPVLSYLDSPLRCPLLPLTPPTLSARG